MESKIRYVLKHKITGLYHTDKPEGTSKKLFDARRFYSEEQLQLWAKVSPYAPDLAQYNVVPVEMTIEEVSVNGDADIGNEIGKSNAGSEVHPENRLQQVSQL